MTFFQNCVIIRCVIKGMRCICKLRSMKYTPYTDICYRYIVKLKKKA